MPSCEIEETRRGRHRGASPKPESCDGITGCSKPSPPQRSIGRGSPCCFGPPGRFPSVSRLSTGDARRAVEYWKQAADHDAAAADEEHLYRRRRLHVSATLGGMVRLDGELDAEGGQTVLNALRSLTDPQQLHPEDRRTSAQRRADAMVDICADHLAHGESAVSGTVRPQVSAIVSLEALEGRIGVPCEFDEGSVITPEAARRL